MQWPLCTQAGQDRSLRLTLEPEVLQASQEDNRSIEQGKEGQARTQTRTSHEDTRGPLSLCVTFDIGGPLSGS